MSEKVSFINIFPMNDRQIQNFDYQKIAKEVVDYSLDIGFKYTLMTVGDKRIDPWVISQYCLQYNSNFSPLIAVNPIYQHPIAVIKKIISLKILFPSKIALNLVSGSFFSELKAIDDNLDFTSRSERLLEFYKSMLALVNSSPAGFKGKYFNAQSAEIFPKYNFAPIDFFVSGSLLEELKTNKEANFVRSIRPLEEMEKATSPNSGLSLGICARSTREEALKEIDRMYPEDRRGEMLFSLSIANNATPWNQWLKNYLSTKGDDNCSYYLKPMKNFWSSAPYLVGSYEEVAERLKAYADLGYSFFILDFLPEDSQHIKKCLSLFKNQ